jgi:protein-S-isoprenylcysteine O-methyltransferase
MNLSDWIFIGSVIAWILFEIWVNSRDRGVIDQGKDRKTKRLIFVYLFLALILGNIFANVSFLSIGLDHSLRFILGSILIWLGFLLRFWSIRTLGKYFKTTVMIQKGHQVVRRGPYRLVRHPSYTGGLMSILGIGLAMGNWIGLLLMILLMLIGYQKRMTVEEEALSKFLSKEYSDYLKTTKRLIPFIY